MMRVQVHNLSSRLSCIVWLDSFQLLSDNDLTTVNIVEHYIVDIGHDPFNHIFAFSEEEEELLVSQFK